MYKEIRGIKSEFHQRGGATREDEKARRTREKKGKISPQSGERRSRTLCVLRASLLLRGPAAPPR
jgi:hypothetical protein